MRDSAALFAVRLVHTIVWVFFVGCILLLPVSAHFGNFALAAALAGFVLLEVVVLAVNRWRCPLTGVAARYTPDQLANFDIFLPLWLARYNKEIFGSLFVVGAAYAALRWWQHAAGA